ncbi:MAG: TonB-dependent receptor [Ignavibacteriae bacterium]|nr:TonB-dependent receptor [Ignavibacteriota bacterium]
MFIKDKKLVLIWISFFLIFYINNFFAQTATIKGVVVDSTSKEILPGANILLEEVNVGAATDKDGKFLIKNLQPGNYKLTTSYVGYQENVLHLNLKVNRTVELVIKLKLESIESKTVTVIARANSSIDAVNKQLSSEQIKNIVSADRLRKLPSGNAAEVVSRVPGVTLIRSGGEGAEIVIRGLAPQYNQITIDGIQLPPNIAVNGEYTQSTLVGDRSTNLSMISSGILGGIEVIKSITPDMDAAVFGGVVNFDLKKAAFDSTNSPSFEFLTQGGYNSIEDNYNNYRFSGTIHQRFFSQNLGFFIQGSVENRNPGGNTLGANYNLTDKLHGDLGIPDLTNVQLGDYQTNYDRKDLTSVLDFEHNSGEVQFKNLFSKYDIKREFRGESLNSNGITYSATDIKDELISIVNILNVNQKIPYLKMDLKIAHAYSESNSPKNLSIYFNQRYNFGNITRLTPKILVSKVIPNDNARYSGISDNSNIVKDRTWTAMADFTSDYYVSDIFTAYFKFGGMFQNRERLYNFDLWSGPASTPSVTISQILRSYWGTQENSNSVIRNFIDNDYSFGDYFDGEYSIYYPVDIKLSNLIYDNFWSPTRTLNDEFRSTIQDYNGTENRSAGYFMSKINFDDLLIILPGVRFQNLATSYLGYRIKITLPQNYDYTVVTKDEENGFWLPMLHLIYKPLSWFQMHFAYTNTLNYPPYSAIVPSYTIDQTSITYNNYALKPATSENFDLVLSFFNNEIGLFSINGFRKKIKNLVFSNQTFVTEFSAYPDLPQNSSQLYTFNTHINNPIPIDIWGIETEWQTHFWYLPQPFSWIEFTINYAHIFSKAAYPKGELYFDYREDGSYTKKIINEFYESRLLNQPNDILNSSIGIDYKGFSSRVSVVYIDNIFQKADFWLQNRVITDKSVRWDISLRQSIPWIYAQIYLDLINLTGTNETTLNEKTNYPKSISRYGMFGNFGLRLNL